MPNTQKNNIKVINEIWKNAILPENATIQNAIQNLNEVAIQIVLVCDQNHKLIGTLSDGDIRRGLLKGLQLNNSIESIIHRSPLVAPVALSKDLLIGLMSVNKVRQLPIVDENNRLVGLHLWENLTKQRDRRTPMVIMAGGLGTRMRPHTENCPKPMLNVAGRPMLEHIIQQAKAEGFLKFYISINYLGDMIVDHFGDGSKFEVDISYIREDMPLGTAGAISLLDPILNIPILVTNGDVMTDIRFGELLDFHERQEADATMAVRLHEWQHPFGVVHMNGVEIMGFEEKPIMRSHINAGVYVLSPVALKYLNHGERCDMPTLFERLAKNGHRIIAYPMHEPWLDVGRPIDLDLAQERFTTQSK